MSSLWLPKYQHGIWEGSQKRSEEPGFPHQKIINYLRHREAKKEQGRGFFKTTTEKDRQNDKKKTSQAHRSLRQKRTTKGRERKNKQGKKKKEREAKKNTNGFLGVQHLLRYRE